MEGCHWLKATRLVCDRAKIQTQICIAPKPASAVPPTSLPPGRLPPPQHPAHQLHVPQGQGRLTSPGTRAQYQASKGACSAVICLQYKPEVSFPPVEALMGRCLPGPHPTEPKPENVCACACAHEHMHMSWSECSCSPAKSCVEVLTPALSVWRCGLRDVRSREGGGPGWDQRPCNTGRRHRSSPSPS